MITKQIKYIPSKQKGATLFTALVFLTLMTIVSVSAAKLSLLDVLVAGNNEQQMRIFQTAENDLNNLTTVPQLYRPITQTPNHKFDETTGIYKLKNPDKPDLKQQIRDAKKRYPCEGVSGLAVSRGPNAQRCELYDFQVVVGKAASGARARHNRGAGKEKPNQGENSLLN